MRALILFLFSFSAFAQTVNHDQAMDFLDHLYKLASGVPGTLGSILVALVMAGYSILMVSRAATNISNYFNAKRIREEEAYKEAQAAKKRQEEDQSRREKDYFISLSEGLEDAWKAKVNRIIELIKTDKHIDALKMVPDDKKNAASEFLYDSEKSPEYRAIEIINLVRVKSALNG